MIDLNSPNPLWPHGVRRHTVYVNLADKSISAEKKKGYQEVRVTAPGDMTRDEVVQYAQSNIGAIYDDSQG